MKGLHSLMNISPSRYRAMKKIISPLAAVSLIGFLLFAYVSHAEIDEATQGTYAAVKALFAVFCILAALSLFAVAFLIYAGRESRKAFPVLARKSRLNSHVYPFDVVNAILMGLFCLCCLYPIWYVLIGSFNQGADYSKGGVYFLPRLLTFENYKVVFVRRALWHSYLITALRTVLGTATALIFTAAVGYAMSRPNLKFKRVFYWINIFTMFFGGGLIPYYLIIRMTGLFDTFWVYIVPGLYSVYNMIVVQSGFAGISNEIHDAANIDGAGELRIWWNIYMPMNKPVLATVILWLAVGHWNSYFDTMLYTNNENLQTLQYYLYRVIKESTATEGMTAEQLERLSAATVSNATIILSIIPVLCLFPLIRKNFASGIMIGSLKG